MQDFKIENIKTLCKLLILKDKSSHKITKEHIYELISQYMKNKNELNDDKKVLCFRSLVKFVPIQKRK